MSPKKKNKTRSSAKPAKKARKRLIKSTSSRKSARKKTAKKKSAPRKKSAQKKTASRPKARSRSSKKKSFVSAETELKREFQRRNLTRSGMVSPRQSEDFEGLSRAEEADSESVDELVEEGNVFEAGAVAGVQEADDADEREVHTHEVPEDDVPDEYLDKD